MILVSVLTSSVQKSFPSKTSAKGTKGARNGGREREVEFRVEQCNGASNVLFNVLMRAVFGVSECSRPAQSETERMGREFIFDKLVLEQQTTSN